MTGKKKFSRRDMMGIMAASAGASLLADNPYVQLMRMILDGFTEKALGAVVNDEHFFLNFSMGGGPPRWMFDCPLIVDPSCDKLSENKMVITRISQNESASGGAMEGEYAVHKYKDLYLPWMWNQTVPTVNGESRPMTDLADNCLFIRGFYNLSSHGLANSLNLIPIPGGEGIHTLTQLKSKTPISGIQYGIRYLFNARNGASSMNVSFNGRDPLSIILQPFNLGGSLSFEPGEENVSDIEKAFDHALDVLSHNVKNTNKKTGNLYNDRKNAKRLFKRGVEGLRAEFEGLRDKYTGLLNAAARETVLPGVFDSPFISDGSIRFQVGSGLFVANGTDLTQAFSNAHYNRMANNLAVCEYVMRNRLSSSMCFNSGGMGFTLPRQDADGNSASNNGGNHHDGHSYGAFPTLFGFSQQYKALTAGFLELINVLKEENIWNNTVIHLSGDFNRRPQTVGSGSDHAGPASNITLISGAIKNPLLVGNCEIGKPSKNSNGDWLRWGGDYGWAAPMDEIGGRTIKPGNIASTVANLLNEQSPTPNDEACARKIKGAVQATMGAKNIFVGTEDKDKVCTLKKS